MRAGINYVRHGSSLPLLWVESRIATPGGHRVGKQGLVAIGLRENVDFIHMNAAQLAALTPAQWSSLSKSYSAIGVASDFGGLLTQAELDQLNAHRGDIKNFVNAGGGLLALSEGGGGAGLTKSGRFGFLPIDIQSTGIANPPYTVSQYGKNNFGLADSDVNSPSHSYFHQDFGLNVVTRSAPTGQIMTLAGEVRITDGGFLVANAGPDQELETSAAKMYVTLDGSESSADAGGLPLHYTWTEGGIEIAHSDAPRVAVELAVGAHTIQLTVTNSRGESATDTVVIVIRKATPAPATWTLTGSLANPRILHTATLLTDGRVLVTGGYNPTTELYDATTGTWSPTGNTSTNHRGHTATLLSDGRVLIAGGTPCLDTNSGSAELYDPALGEWKPAGQLNHLRFFHTATRLPSGKVLVVGGGDSEYGSNVLASAELYDPATGVWTLTGGLNTARRYHTATLLPSGKVLVVGGSDTNSNSLTSAEVYDPTTGTWTFAGDMGGARRQHTATLLSSGKVLVVGGGAEWGTGSSTELYDPATGTWSAADDMNKPRRLHTATLLPDGRVLVAGGYHDYTGIQYASEVYDPATNTWRDTVPMNVERYQHTATLLPDGTVLAVGGFSNTDQASSEYYTP